MKNNNISKALLAVAVAVAATACDENAWNDKLDGFEGIEDQPKQDVQSVDYTLTDADYSSIASNSTNTALAGEDGKAALAAVGSLKRFSADAPASVYVPAFLSSTGFPYFTLTDGSSVRLTYNEAVNEPEEFVEAQTVQLYAVTAQEYQEKVWASDDYVAAFAPSKQPADYLPAILGGALDPADGSFAVVTYQMATQEPNFGGNAPAEPVEVYNNTLTDEDSYNTFTADNKVLPEGLTYIWSWGGANYGAKASGFANNTNYDAEAWLVSPEIDLTAYADATLSYEQATNFFSSVDVLADQAAAYVREKGGNWVKLSPVYPDKMSWTFVASGDIDISDFAGKKIELGFCYKSTAAKAGTWEVKNIKIMATPASRSSRAAISVPSEARNAVYRYSNNKWAPAGNSFAVLQPADYTAMGQTYNNLPAAEPYLSKWLDINAPYAAADDVKYVYWLNYASGATTCKCSAYKYDGSAWAPYSFVETVTNQFVRNEGKWMFDPNVTITLPAGKGQEMSTLYFQACVDWVFENICKPLGDTSIKSGKFYVSSYGNNEYYSGTSAYQGNVDLRASSARAQYPAEYESMTDEAIIELERTRFMTEVMPGALAAIHPDAAPIEGLDVLYTVNFYTYMEDRSTKTCQAIFKVAGPGKFAPVSCNWNVDDPANKPVVFE